jgi:hypothetical protein
MNRRAVYSQFADFVARELVFLERLFDFLERGAVGLILLENALEILTGG